MTSCPANLVTEWIIGQSHGGVGTPEWNCRESLMLDVLAMPEENPELAWNFILEVIEQCPSEDVLGILSASLLEDLLTDHGPHFLTRVVEQAGKSPLFKQILGQVWLDEEDTPVWRQIYEIAGVTPPFPEGWRSNSLFKRTPGGAA